MGLVKADGTPLAEAPGNTVIESVAEAEPRVKVKINVYKVTAYDHVNYPTVKQQLWFREGQIIKKKEWDAEFQDATVTSIHPDEGDIAGGTAVTITGKGFSSTATVTVGGNAVTSKVVVNDKKITGVTAAHAAGAVDVVVTTAAGAATLDDGFTYIDE